MKRERLTMSQALVKFLDNQYIECDGVESKFVSGIFGIFGHGCVVGVGQALEQGGHNLKFYQGKNEQNMALAAVAYAKQMDRKAIIPCVSSIGPGATNMVTACGCATANRIPLLVLPGDTFACRQPDPVLQQAEFFDSYGRTVNDAFKGVCHYFDRIERLEEEVKNIRADIREIFAEAKGNGFDPKVMRQVLRLRKMNPADRAEAEFLMEAYKQALGME